MKFTRKKWLMFLLLAIVNLIVILSFIFLTQRIRKDDNLKIKSSEIPVLSGDFLI